MLSMILQINVQPQYNGGAGAIAYLFLLLFYFSVFTFSLVLIAKKKYFSLGVTLSLFGFFFFHTGLSQFGFRTFTASHYRVVGIGGFFIGLGVVICLWSLRRYCVSNQANVERRVKILKRAGVLCLIPTFIFFIFSLMGLYTLMSVQCAIARAYVEVLLFAGVGFTFFIFSRVITIRE